MRCAFCVVLCGFVGFCGVVLGFLVVGVVVVGVVVVLTYSLSEQFRMLSILLVLVFVLVQFAIST